MERKIKVKQNVLAFDTATKAANSDKRVSKQERENAAVIKMMRSATRVAFTFEQLNATLMSVDRGEKAIQFTATDGKVVHVTLARMKKTQDQWFKDHKPFKRAPASTGGDGEKDKSILATHVKSSPIDAAESLSAAMQSIGSVDKRKEMVDTSQVETLLCNILAAKFMRGKVLDLTAFNSWIVTQTYFKSDGYSISGQIVPTSELTKSKPKVASK